MTKKTDEPFTMIPNRVLRSSKLDAYDKIIYSLLASFHPSFPSYGRLEELGNMSRERVWKSLHKLDEMNMIFRVKVGRKIYYQCALTSSPHEPIQGQPVRFANRNSSPHELVTVRHTNHNQFATRTLIRSKKKIKEKEQKKRDEIPEETHVSMGDKPGKNPEPIDPEILAANERLLRARSRLEKPNPLERAGEEEVHFE